MVFQAQGLEFAIFSVPKFSKTSYLESNQESLLKNTPHAVTKKQLLDVTHTADSPDEFSEGLKGFYRYFRIHKLSILF